MVDTTTDAWYRAHKIVIRGTEKNVIYLRSPSSKDGKKINEAFVPAEALHPSEGLLSVEGFVVYSGI